VSFESRVGRALWPALMLVLLAHAVSDLLHHPFLGDTGDAAIVDAHLTLWVPGTEVGGPSEAVARQAAASLQLTGRPATVKVRRDGGAAGAVTSFLGPGGSARPGDLLVVSSATVADLARGRSDALFGDVATTAADAAALLGGARPVAVLAEDALQLAVRPGSKIRTGAQLARRLAAHPRAHLVAIEGDAWTRAQLGRLVQRADVSGRVPYRAYPSGAEAALGLAAGEADVVLAPSSELHDEVAAGHLRVLSWPSSDGRAPRAWTALLEAPGLRPGQHARIRDELRRLAADPQWRRALRDAGRTAPGAGAAVPRDFLARRVAAAAWLQRVTARVEGV
jgi:tripartite-type tricarboxylate transporter receptor subunit TctC